MDKDTAVNKLRDKYRNYIKLDVWSSESARLMQMECDEIADFIEQQANILRQLVGEETNWQDNNLQEKYESEIAELKMKVEQQAKQIYQMRDCSNCIQNLRPCYGNEKGEPCDGWAWVNDLVITNEFCHHCESENEFTVRADCYTEVCAHCGKKLMLCTKCHDDSGTGYCDWSDGKGCYREDGGSGD